MVARIKADTVAERCRLKAQLSREHPLKSSILYGHKKKRDQKAQEKLTTKINDKVEKPDKLSATIVKSEDQKESKSDDFEDMIDGGYDCIICHAHFDDRTKVTAVCKNIYNYPEQLSITNEQSVTL